MERIKTFGKLLTKFNLEKPGKWHFLTNHAMIKTWKLTKNDIKNLLGEWGPSIDLNNYDKLHRNVKYCMKTQNAKDCIKNPCLFRKKLEALQMRITTGCLSDA